VQSRQAPALINTCHGSRTSLPQHASTPLITSSRISTQPTTRHRRRGRAGRERHDVESDDDGGCSGAQPAKVCVLWRYSPPHQHPGLHRTLKALDMSNLIITSGSEGSELSEAYIAERILAQWEAPSWRPAVCKNNWYVDVKIREIGPRTAAAARLARQRRQRSPQMMSRRPPGEPSGFAGSQAREELRLRILVRGRGENNKKDKGV
jgi:hypothetical protein